MSVPTTLTEGLSVTYPAGSLFARTYTVVGTPTTDRRCLLYNTRADTFIEVDTDKCTPTIAAHDTADVVDALVAYWRKGTPTYHWGEGVIDPRGLCPQCGGEATDCPAMLRVFPWLADIRPDWELNLLEEWSDG